MTPPDNHSRGDRATLGVAAVAVVGAITAMLLLAGEPKDSSKASPAAATSPPGELSAESAPAPTPATPAEPAGTSGAAPLNLSTDEAEEVVPYSSKSRAVEHTSAEQERAAAAIADLERATSGIHACEAKAQARHERLGRPGRADPLLCVYDHTSMGNQVGRVRMDYVTTKSYSYFVDVGDLRYRYIETNGTGCRTIDELTGCAAW